MPLKSKRTIDPAQNYYAFKKDWYFDFLKEWKDRLSVENKNEALQVEYMDALYQRIYANLDNKNLGLLNDEDVEKFWRGVKKNLQNIDDNIIIKQGDNLNQALSYFLIKLKDSSPPTATYETNDIVLRTKTGKVFAKASNASLVIEMMSYNKVTKRLTVMGVSEFPTDRKTTQLILSVDGTQTIVKDSLVYSDVKVFGKTVHRKLPFRFDVDLKNTAVPKKISFSLENKDFSTEVPLRLVFGSFMSKLSGRVSYWRFGYYMASHNGYRISIKRNSAETILREVLMLLIISVINRRPRAAILRTLYWLTKPVLGRRKIWLYMDKPYKSGDNAEWLYRHAASQQDGIHHHYVLHKDSPDAQKFQEAKVKFVKYKSIWQRILFLHANILIFTHSNAPAYYRFGGLNEIFFRDLYKYDLMYVQHGLIVQDMAWLYKKSYDNIKRFFIASRFEKDNLLRPEYGYKPSEIITSGAARYDGLINNDKRNVIIAPTWRTYLAPRSRDIGESPGPDEHFRNTDFYKIYSSLITDKKLVSTAERLGYSLTFLLHPSMSAQADDFKQYGYVQVIPTNKGFDHRKILTESSLLVTDYSGIQFDFAYMYKPVVYFHPAELPPSYQEGSYEYEKHALGEVTKRIDALVDLVCEYMESACRIKPKYKKRVDEFFYHHDKNNAKRIYDAVLSWQNENQ